MALNEILVKQGSPLIKVGLGFNEKQCSKIAKVEGSTS